MINGFINIRSIANAAKFSAVSNIIIKAVILGGPANNTAESEEARLRIGNELRAKGWNVISVALSGIILTVEVVGSSSDNLRTVEQAFERGLLSVGTFVSDVSARFTSGATPAPPQVPIPAPVPTVTEKTLDDRLRELGIKLGFSPTGALIGGVMVIGVAAIILLKKQ